MIFIIFVFHREHVYDAKIKIVYKSYTHPKTFELSIHEGEGAIEKIHGSSFRFEIHEY